MTDTCTKPSRKRFKLKNFSAKGLMAATLSMTVCAPSIQAANDQWWFDVEVIVFARDIDSNNISEQFEQSSLVPPLDDHSGDLIDLLSAYVKPDLSFIRAGLPYCRETKRLEIAKKYQQDSAFPTSQTSEQDIPESGDPTGIAVADLIELEPTTTDTFEYEVVSDDIFNSDTVETTPKETELIQQPEQSELQEQEVALLAEPIEVKFIEWQVPSEFPCVYSEQVDPTLVLLSHPTAAENAKQMRPELTAVPTKIDGIHWQHKRGPFLLPTNTFRMDKLFSKLQKQRNITPILHINWRQEVLFGRENAKTFRIFAGKNFAGQFAQTGQVIEPDTDNLISSLTIADSQGYMPLQELALEYNTQQQNNQLNTNQTVLETAQVSEQLFADIDAALNDDSPISFALPINQPERSTETSSNLTKLQDIWQLDGGIKVYLQNVGRIPYLHIDSQLDYRHGIYRSELTPSLSSEANSQVVNELSADQPLLPNYLQSVPFNQLRRVISKQVHYFDHPLFGMIVRIHRYRWPEQDGTDSDDATE